MKTPSLLAAALIVIAALARPLVAAPPNLLANGGFEERLAGWSWAADVVWSPLFGGAARINQPTSSGSEALQQCVSVEGGALYSLSAAAFLPQRADGDGGLSVRVRWFEDETCQGSVLRGAPSLEFEASREIRQVKSRVLVSPASVRSAIVQLVARADSPSTYPVFVDDVAFSPEDVGELLTLPTASSLRGASGQRVATDLWVRNTSALARRFSIRMICPAPCSPNPGWISMNLGPFETRALPDVVSDYLGGGGRDRTGAIEISYDPRDGAIEVFARTATADEERSGNGTAIPARRREERRTQASFIGLTGLGGEAGFRVDAGAFNPTDRATPVTLVVRDAAGDYLGSVTRTWAAREWFQIDDVLARAGAPADRAASILMYASVPLHPFAIAIDNRSGDATWLEPAAPAPRH